MEQIQKPLLQLALFQHEQRTSLLWQSLHHFEHTREKCYARPLGADVVTKHGDHDDSKIKRRRN
jgi:hypothetical protein